LTGENCRFLKTGYCLGSLAVPVLMVLVEAKTAF
jgi:hypothetical protein